MGIKPRPGRALRFGRGIKPINETLPQLPSPPQLPQLSSVDRTETNPSTAELDEFF